jgi:(1->4)-alpha-D-glucan 1-alpha-D-glucosylmutase
VLRATYRVQLTPECGFAALTAALPYLQQLGISHLYLSPVFRSRPGSTHGYDVTDHSRIDEQLGGRAGFDALATACRDAGMGVLLDIVPNHMAVLGADNTWWCDVLENGPASRFAHYFDIDWVPARASMRNRLLVPVLAAPLGEVIDRGELRVGFSPAKGSFEVHYGTLDFPVEPRGYPLIFAGHAPSLATGIASVPACQEMASLLDGFAALPPPLAAPEDVLQVRDRDREVNKRRLARLCEREPSVLKFIEGALERVNAPASDALAGLLQAQPYRLAYWRVSGEEINYRRFFDVNDLAALRVEEPEVFTASHALLRELWLAGSIDGVRVDHADGLYDPAQYLDRLRDTLPAEDGRRPWMLVEKILGQNEKLRADWCADGTTGYEFGALVTGWLVHGPGLAALEKIWQRFTGRTTACADILYESRKQVMRTSLAAEVSMLAARLDRLAQLHRDTSDFTVFDLREAIVEVIACFPVYRTYIASTRMDAEDAQHIRRAIGAAFSRKHTAARALAFLEQVLLGGLAEDPVRSRAALAFTQKFQQVTAPVMAKGVEDTAFYRRARLLAFNEVGGDLDGRALSTEALHRASEARARDRPRTMISTSTHDSKRGEDVRFRLCVLSEMPHAWAECLGRWRRLKRRRPSADVPAAVQEYILLQSLLGIWPQDPAGTDLQALRARLGEFAIKSAREAKEATSWLDQDDEVERALRDLVSVLLPANGAAGFERYFRALLDPVAYFGMLNTLAALVLKLTSPGVPDFYQGSELPTLTLVDPDNRRQVDFTAFATQFESIRQRLVHEPRAAVAGSLLQSWQGGCIKLFVTAMLLELRRTHHSAFDGGYLALGVEGDLAEHLCAFARLNEGQVVIVLVSRWAALLGAGAMRAPLGVEIWRDTTVLLPREVPAGTYVDVLLDREWAIAGSREEHSRLLAGELLATLPCCVLALREAA